MSDSEINPYITITKIDSGEKLQIEQKYVSIRENREKVMAVSYKAPLYETIEFEKFFDEVNASQRLKFNIGGTGSIGVNFRGMIDGKEKNPIENINHKIVLLEEYKCPKKEDYETMKRSSTKFITKVPPKKEV
ncbi:hypothetical protein [Methanobrevibacter sp. DSM 116169]|uniref:hypothetical protein n=1 Tax=Methanobrevibacter sp. DSM 116169 TaxID=3242727 RepID=UPI0038FC27E7